MTPARPPTDAELDLLADLTIAGDRLDYEWQQARDMLAEAAVAVFPEYMTDTPGYRGRVAVVVWGGSPDLFDIFTLDGATPRAMPHDPDKVTR